MIRIGYFANHEQFSPLTLLENAALAESCGFDTVWNSDHFHPWGHSGAQCGQAWAWMGALGQRTSSVSFGTGISAPIHRYHPGLLAQTFATLGSMFPGRVFLGMGTGEAMNELPLGYEWPSPAERLERLSEALTIIRRLWNEEWVTFHGKHFQVKKANLYTKSPKEIPIYVAGSGEKVTRLAARMADGFITVTTPEGDKEKKLLEIFTDETRRLDSERDTRKIILVHSAYDEDYDIAVRALHFWRGSMLPIFFTYGIADPREIEQAGSVVSDEAIAKTFMVITNPEQVIRKIEHYRQMGYNEVVFPCSGPDVKKFIRMMGRDVIPVVRQEADR